MTTAETMQKRLWESDYEVTADYLPFRRWHVQAYSAAEACREVHALTGIPLDQLEAAK